MKIYDAEKGKSVFVGSHWSDDRGLSTRAQSVLYNCGIESVEDFRSRRKVFFSEQPNCGEKTIREMEIALGPLLGRQEPVEPENPVDRSELNTVSGMATIARRWVDGETQSQIALDYGALNAIVSVRIREFVEMMLGLSAEGKYARERIRMVRRALFVYSEQYVGF